MDSNKNYTFRILQIIQKMTHQVYKEDYSSIIDPVNGCGGLIIGNLEAAQNLNTIRKHQVKAILTSCKGINLGHTRTDIPYYLHIQGEDHEGFDLSKYFHQAANFINDCLQRTNIIVHCLAGVSRSVSFVIAYFMKHKGYSFQKAFETIKARRRIIHPNQGFIQQLKRFQREIGNHGNHEVKSLSSSPSKRLLQRENSLSSSPTKKYNPSPQIEAIISKYESYKNMSYSSIKKNPELPLELKKIESFPQTGIEKSQFRCKRVASMNVDRNQVYQSRNDFGSYSRRISEFSPLESIQNLSSQSGSAVSDIDKKIQEIRRKYQEYQTPSVPSYGRFSSINYDQNTSKRGSMNMERDYSKYGCGGMNKDFTTSRLKRLTSFQEY